MPTYSYTYTTSSSRHRRARHLRSLSTPEAEATGALLGDTGSRTPEDDVADSEAMRDRGSGLDWDLGGPVLVVVCARLRRCHHTHNQLGSDEGARRTV